MLLLFPFNCLKGVGAGARRRGGPDAPLLTRPEGVREPAGRGPFPEGEDLLPEAREPEEPEGRGAREPERREEEAEEEETDRPFKDLLSLDTEAETF